MQQTRWIRSSVFLLVALMAACSSSSETDTDADVRTDSQTLDDIDDVSDTHGTVEDDAVDVQAKDVVEDDTDISDEIDSADATDCTYPKEGCPCDPALGSQECCLFAGVGLDCGILNSQHVWMRFYDCGCSTLPDCADYPLYSLCPTGR